MKAKRKRPSPLSAAVPPITPPPPAIRSFTSHHTALAVLVLLVLTGLAFSDSFHAGLTLDNQMLVAGDPRIREVSGGNISQIFQHTFWWPNGEAGLYRPLTTLSFLFNYAVLGNGVDTAGYHWINFLLHFGNVLLVLALAQRLVGRNAVYIAALWAIHPVLTESVTNIIGRADLLAGMAVLGGLLMYLKSVEATGWRLVAWLAGLAGAAAAGASSKESAVVLPGIIILHAIAFKSGNLRALLRGCVATILPIGIVLWQRFLVLAASPPAEFPFVDNPITGADFWTGRLTAIKVVARYLWLTVWPVRLSADYSYSEIPLARGSFADWCAWIAVAMVLCAAALLWKNSYRTAFFFICFGFINLLPASNLLFPAGTIMAERLLYLPLVGWLACVVMAVDFAASRARQPHAAPILLSLIAIAFAGRTWVRNLDWKDNLTIAAASVRTSPNSFKVHRLLAVSLFQSDPEYAHIDRVIDEAKKSLAILATLPDRLDVPAPWNEAASYYLAKGDSLEAARLARRSLAIEAAAGLTKAPVPPVVADSYRILATADLRAGRIDEALSASLKAQALAPSNVEVYGQIADAYLAQSRGEEAAITLAEGMFATSNGGLRADLLKLYQSGVDTSGCAVVPGPRGPALNPSCDIVRRDLCAGAARANRKDMLQQLPCSN